MSAGSGALSTSTNALPGDTLQSLSHGLIGRPAPSLGTRYTQCRYHCQAATPGANQTEQQQLYDYGINMGIAFQIQDDLLDLYGDPSLVGKQVGGDIIANKNTLLMILAKEDANSDQLNRINELTKELNSEAKIQGVLTLFEQLNVNDKCAKLMNSYYDSAQGHLNNIESKSNKSALWRLTNALQHRAY